MGSLEQAYWRINSDLCGLFQNPNFKHCPLKENRKDLLWLFWKELSAELKEIFVVHPPAINDVEFVIQEIINIAYSLKEQDPADDSTEK